MGRQTSGCLSCYVNNKKLIIVMDRFFFSSLNGIGDTSLLILDIRLQHLNYLLP